MDTSNTQLPSALLAFHDNHPILTALLHIVYALGFGIYFFILCERLHDLSTVPWLPTIFLTDGILVWFCPLAAMLPVLLWPLFPLCYLLVVCFQLLLACFGLFLACFRFSLAAPTFCGIKREVFVGLYRACADRFRPWKWNRQDGKQRRAPPPITNGDMKYEPL